jgi:glycosyltransferase involved in cell wall biosynthesis
MPVSLSIVTITWNNLEGLKRTMDALSDQSSFDFEHIVVDGGSTDGSREYLEKLSLPWHLNWSSEKDAGRYEAMNKGTRRAEGEFVWYLNAGDVPADAKVVSDLLRQIRGDKKLDLLYGKIIFETAHGEVTSGRSAEASDFKYFMPVSHPGILFRRSLLLEQPYRTDYVMISDWIAIRQFFAGSFRREYYDRVFARFDDQGISTQFLWKDFWEKFRFEKSIRAKVELSVFLGGKLLLIDTAKFMGLYSHFKKWKVSRS